MMSEILEIIAEALNSITSIQSPNDKNKYNANFVASELKINIKFQRILIYPALGIGSKPYIMVLIKAKRPPQSSIQCEQIFK